MFQSDDEINRYDGLIEAAKTPDDLIAPCRLLCTASGFDFFVLGIRSPSPDGRHVQLAVTGLPKSWDKIYEERKYMLIDPLILATLMRVKPFCWDEINFNERPEVAEMRAESYRHNLNYGLTIPFHGPRLGEGILNFVRKEGAIPSEPSARRELLNSIAGYGAQLYDKLQSIVEAQYKAETERLSAREREVLSAQVLGHRAKIAASMLGISTSTIAYHVTNLMVKLGAKNIAQAAITASIKGDLIVNYPETIAESTYWAKEDGEGGVNAS